MATEVYGISDDLIEIEGDVSGEFNYWVSDDDGSHGVLLNFSDGTILAVKYGKLCMSIWGIDVLVVGSLFKCINTCIDEDDERYSDTAHFNDGLSWAIASDRWERIG